MNMPKLSLASLDLQKAKADLLILPVYLSELGGKGKKSRASLASISTAMGGALESVAKSEKFTGKFGQSFELFTEGRLGCERLRVVGLGKSGQKSASKLRLAIATATRAARATDRSKLVISIPEDRQDGEGVQASAEAALLGAYRFDRYISEDKEARGQSPIKEVKFHLAKAADAKLKRAFAIGEAIGHSTNAARDLVNEPAGTMTPITLANAAKTVAKECGLGFKAYGPKEINNFKMGMFSAVAQGSDEEPRFIVLEYKPKTGAKSKGKGKSKAGAGRGLAFVGKGVTFDSGGYDLKGAPFMLDMKMDMGGAAAVISAMRAVAKIAPPFPVTAYAGACENLVSGHAYKPGDVLTSRKGKTVEINNTDAEGRLVLGDILTYATDQGHDTIIDVATLTGACMVALGNFTVGLLSNNDDLSRELVAASRAAGEDFWRLPLNSALAPQLKSSIADLRNTGERFGGAITAGLFLQNFVGKDVAWAHLDIAGPAFLSSPNGVDPKGASGAAVRSLAQLVRARADKA